jgi:hypothetical protein
VELIAFCVAVTVRAIYREYGPETSLSRYTLCIPLRPDCFHARAGAFPWGDERSYFL